MTAPAELATQEVASATEPHQNVARDESRALRTDFAVACLGVVALFLVRVVAGIFEAGGEEIGSHLHYFAEFVAALISIAVIGTAGRSMLADAVKELARARLTYLSLEAFGVLTALAYEIYALFADMNGLSAQAIYHYPPVILVGVVGVRMVLYRVTRHLAGQLVTPLSVRAPRYRGVDGVERAARDATPGTEFVVKAGEVVPLDGEVVKGVAAVRERRWAAAPLFRIKGDGQGVFAGSDVVQGEVHCRALGGQEDSLHHQFVEGVQRVLAEGLSRGGSSLITSLCLGIVFVAACAALFWSGQLVELSDGRFSVVARAVSAVLVSASVLRVAALLPLLYGVVVSRLFERGAVVKDFAVVRRIPTLKSWVFEADTLRDYRTWSLAKFHVIDQRIDRRSLMSVVLALLSDSEDSAHEAVVAGLSKECLDPFLYGVTQFHAYQGRGVLGTVQGAEFTVGSEDFLVQRGVALQASEVEALKPQERVIYVAMGDEVVASCRVVPAGESELAELFEGMRTHGARIALCSQEASQGLDEFAKRVQVELASVYGGLVGEAYRTKLQELRPVGHYASMPHRGELAQEIDVSVAPFDQIRWNQASTDITLYGRVFAPLGEAVSQCIRCVRAERALWRGALLLTAIGAVASFFTLAPAIVWLVGAAVLASLAVL